MTGALATVDRERFSKPLRLVLGSDKDGEIIGAVAALKRALAAAGLDSHWIADAFERGAAVPVVVPGSEERNYVSDLWYAHHRRNLLSERDRRFVETLVNWRGMPSEKQLKWLNDIIVKLGRGAAAA
jgi:DNA-binding transcriptional LysR family regulator